MLSIFDAIILGLIQGVSEWLPISSSGHLIIAQKLLGVNVPILFDAALHLGSVIVIVVVYWKEIVKILRSLKNFNRNSEEGKTILFIIGGSIPTGLIGFIFLGYLESAFSNLLVAGATFVATGVPLYLTKYSKHNREMSYTDSVLIGVAQGIAILPGASRSGWTISTGLLRNVKWEIAARYSFLLAIPAILGANLLELKDAAIFQADLLPLTIAVAVTVVVGYATLRTLLKIIARGRFHLFSYYCWAIGITILAASIYLV